MLDEEAKVVLGSGNDRGSTFRLNRFLNARAPLTKIVGKKYLRHFFRYSRCVPRPDGTVHPAAVIFSFELVFRRGLKLPNLGTPQKKSGAHLYRSTRPSHGEIPQLSTDHSMDRYAHIEKHASIRGRCLPDTVGRSWWG